MPVRFKCPNRECGVTLSISQRKAGDTVPCPTCRHLVIVPRIESQPGIRVHELDDDDASVEKNRTPITRSRSGSEAKIARSLQPLENGYRTSTRSPVRLILSVGGMASGAMGLVALVSFALHFWIIGVVFSLVFALVVALTIKGLVEVTMAKAGAIRRGDREVDLFFKCVKLVLWEENEGLLFLKDKRIQEVIYGPDRGGGMRFIFPILGDEVKVHVPLTLQMSQFEDKKVLTRESIQLYIKVAIWWRIKDREGLEDFYLLIDKEIHVATNTEMWAKEVDYGEGGKPDGARKGPRRSELNAAERWMVTLVESSLRKLVSRTSVAWLISKNASAYLHVGSQHDEQRAQPAPALTSSQEEEGHAMPDLMAKSLKDMLAPEAEKYGLEIERIEIQEVRMPQEIQEAIDRVWKATLLPAQTSQESIAKAQQIQAELGTVAKILGTEAAGAAVIASNMQGMNFYGGVGSILEKLLNLSAKSGPELPKLQEGQSPSGLQPGTEWPDKPKT